MMMNVKEILYAGSIIAKTSNRTLLIRLTAVFDHVQKKEVIVMMMMNVKEI